MRDNGGHNGNHGRNSSVTNHDRLRFRSRRGDNHRLRLRNDNRFRFSNNNRLGFRDSDRRRFSRSSGQHLRQVR